MSSEPLVSIIIPCRTIDEVTRNCVLKCHALEYQSLEIVVLPDDESPLDGAKVVPTGAVSPGKKRNVGAVVAKGDVFAYTDADAYPRPDWLSNAVN